MIECSNNRSPCVTCVNKGPDRNSGTCATCIEPSKWAEKQHDPYLSTHERIYGKETSGKRKDATKTRGIRMIDEAAALEIEKKIKIAKYSILCRRYENITWNTVAKRLGKNSNTIKSWIINYGVTI